MAISNTLSNMISNLENAYSALSLYSATIPSNKNFQNLTSTIQTAQAGDNIYYQFVNNTMKTLNDTGGSISSCFSFAFAYMSALNSVYLPALNTVPNACFFECPSLREIYLPSCYYIETSAFTFCSSLETASFPLVQEISSRGFGSCGISEIFLPNCLSMSNQAFGDCPNLRKVTFSAIQNFSAGACFVRCNSLSIVDLTGVSSVPNMSMSIFASTPIHISTYLGYFGSIYVPSSLYTAFMNASGGWSEYYSRITSASVPN